MTGWRILRPLYGRAQTRPGWRSLLKEPKEQREKLIIKVNGSKGDTDDHSAVKAVGDKTAEAEAGQVRLQASRPSQRPNIEVQWQSCRVLQSEGGLRDCGYEDEVVTVAERSMCLRLQLWALRVFFGHPERAHAVAVLDFNHSFAGRSWHAERGSNFAAAGIIREVHTVGWRKLTE